MGRLKLDILISLIALVLVNCVVQCQYYIPSQQGPPRPIYLEGVTQPFLPREEIDQGQGAFFDGLPEPNSQFMSRSGSASESEEDDEGSEESEEERRFVPPPQGRSRPINLPPNFDEKVNRQLKVVKRQKSPLHGDPSPINQDDDDGRRPESRLLWPFSIEITKGDKASGGWGGGPQQYGSSFGGSGHHHHPGYQQLGHFHHSSKGPHHHKGHKGHKVLYGKDYDPDDDPEVQKLRIEMYKMVTRTKKWKKILKYNLAEVGAQVVTKVIDYLDFI